MNRLFVLGFASLLLLPHVDLSAATVSGKVSFQSKRGQNPTVAETLISLEPQSSTKVAKRPAGTFQMLTRGKALVPHVLAVPLGSTVTFPNDDPISHNLFSLSTPNGFDLGLYRKGAGKSQKFDNPGLVNVYCNVHPNMSAVIQVMPTPLYAFADSTGAFSVPDVPAGKYKLVAWNEQGGRSESLIDVPATGAANLAVTLDSRTYRQTQHTNKTGKAYENPTSKDY